MQHARLAAFWTVAGVLGTLAVFPYALAINPAVAAQLPVPLPALVAAQTAQTGILLLLLSWVGLRLGQPLGLNSPFARALAGRQKLPATPAAFERKHPVDARQQLCPQISRRVSAPRSAALYPGHSGDQLLSMSLPPSFAAFVERSLVTRL